MHFENKQIQTRPDVEIPSGLDCLFVNRWTRPNMHLVHHAQQ